MKKRTQDAVLIKKFETKALRKALLGNVRGGMRRDGSNQGSTACPGGHTYCACTCA